MLVCRVVSRMYLGGPYARPRVFGYTPFPVVRDLVRPLGED